MSTNLVKAGRPAEILLVEDDDNDVELTRIGFERAHFAVNLHHVGDGEECMKFLRKESPYEGSPTPDVVLLDLNMPRMDGREVLAAVSRDEQLMHLPIIVLTTSDSDRDVLASYRLRCSSYIVKPVDFENFSKAIQSIADYWFVLTVLPSGTGSPTG